jgi:ribonuclease Z
MKLTFLGTGAGAPTRHRNVSGIGLQFIQQSILWLFDCGEGTQQQILRSPLKLSQLERVFITHMHGDHVFGLPGMLASRSLQQTTLTPVTIYGPAGVEQYVQTALGLSGSHLSYPITTVTVQPGLLYEDALCTVECIQLQHRITAFGYAVIEKEQPGHFDAEAAKDLGIPPGPLYGRLKNGEVVTLDDGRIIDGTTLVGPSRPGRKIVYCSDTIFCNASIDLARNADVLIHEATYNEEDYDLAIRGGHSTAQQAAQVAAAAQVKTLILTHFSARYESKEGPGIESLLAEAQAIFPNTLIANDFWSHEITRKG